MSYHNKTCTGAEMAGEINFYSPCEPKFRDHGPSRTPFYPIYMVKP